MKKLRLKSVSYITLFLFNLTVYSVWGQTIPEPTGKVVSDYSEILTNEEEEFLAKKVKAVFQETGNQLFIITVPTNYYSSSSINDFAQALFVKWKPGQEGADNGLLLIIGGSLADSVNRSLRIQTGYGIEAMLTDIECSRIEKETMVPELKQHHYFEAIQKGTDEILKRISMFKIIKKTALNTILFTENDPVEDLAHCFTPEQINKLKTYNTNMFGGSICKIKTDFNLSAVNGVMDGSLYTYSKFDIYMYVSPWIMVPVKDSLFVEELGKHAYDFKVSNEVVDVAEVNAYFKKNGYYKTVLYCIDKTTSYQQRAFLYFILIMLFPMLLYAVAVFFHRKQKTGVYKRADMKGKHLGLKIIVWTVFVISLLQCITLTFFQTGFAVLYLQESGYSLKNAHWIILVILGLTNFMFCIMAWFKTQDFLSAVVGVDFKSSGGYSSTYSGSSTSSSHTSSYNNSYNSSSSSYSSSSSNSGYYGGGGRSGGGGASTNW